MKSIYKAIKEECRKVIIATNGNPLNRDITPIYDKFKPFCGLDVVPHVQNAMSYFRFPRHKRNSANNTITLINH